jgi:hypothetical protein
MSNEQMMNYNNLIHGDRYIFQVKRPYEDNPTTFKANFAYIIQKTIALTNYDDGVNIMEITAIRTMPLDWIKDFAQTEQIIDPYITTLDDILIEMNNST